MDQWSGAEILAVWERGAAQDWPRRGLILLSAWPPAAEVADHTALTVGERDAWLFQLCGRLFGARMACTAECPACAALLQFDLDAGDFSQPPAGGDDLFEVALHERYRIRLRPLTSADLLAAGRVGGIAAMRRILLERAVCEVFVDGAAASVAALPEEIIGALGDQLAQRDGAELLLDLRCAACRHGWSQPFDILSFLWSELARYAKRLLREVHTLAWAYGWSEGDILAMSAVRRRVYLEWVQ